MMLKRVFLPLAAAAATLAVSAAHAQDDLVLGVELPISVVNMPMFVTIDRLEEQGYAVSMVEFQSPETMTLALQNGQVDVIGVSVGTGFAAATAGLDARFIIGLAKSDFQMVATAGLDTCESLDGRNVAIHSYEGTTGTMTTRWLENTCPEANPNVMIVPGSENRLAGMLAGQIEASAIDSQAALQLMTERPGEFDVIESFGEDAQLASVYIAREGWLEEKPEVARALGQTYVEVVEEMTADPQLLIDETIARVEDVDPATLTEVAQGWIDRGTFVPVWGVTPQVVQDAIDFYSRGEGYEGISSAEEVTTDEYVTSE